MAVLTIVIIPIAVACYSVQILSVWYTRTKIIKSINEICYLLILFELSAVLIICVFIRPHD